MRLDPISGGLLIGGAEVEATSGDALALVDPSSGDAFGEVASAGGADVDRAVAAAREAFDGRWSLVTPAARGQALYDVASQIRAQADSLAHLDALDAGLPLPFARRDAETAARYFEYYAGAADKLHGESIPMGPGVVDYTVREPHGVCGVIVPFNVPLQLMARSVAPALAAGNTVVVKPAEQAPLAPLALGRLLVEHLPAGAVNVVQGLGAEAGQQLAAHPDIDHVTFTGSLPTGRRVMRAAAEHMTPVTIELGGKSPQVLLADADMDRAVDAIVASTLLTAGQVCSAGTRVLVDRSLHDTVCHALSARAGGISIGAALDGPDMGPLVSRAQQQRVLEAVEQGRKTARLLTGGRASARSQLAGGFFVEPTIFADVDPAAPLAREEIFGPVLSVLPFDGVSEALRLANDSDYGLVAGIWTRDLSHALGLAANLQVGQVFVNNYGVGGGVELPFGGRKRSGVGREKGLAALLEYTQVKNVCITADVP